jgi:hypothetical protein
MSAEMRRDETRRDSPFHGLLELLRLVVGVPSVLQLCSKLVSFLRISDTLRPPHVEINVQPPTWPQGQLPRG